MNRTAAILTVLFSVFTGALPVSAGYYSLTNNDSWMEVDTESAYGIRGVQGLGYANGGVNHMYEHWFWYRTNSVAPEVPLVGEILSIISETGTVDSTTTVLGGDGFVARITTLLIDDPVGSNTVGCTMTVKITNTNRTALEFHLFAYTDFDLNDTIDNSWLKIDNDGAVQAIAGIVSRESLSPKADAYTVDDYPILVDRLDDAVADSFTNSGSMGMADNTYAHQWNRVLGTNASFEIQIDITVAPTTKFLIERMSGVGTNMSLSWESNPAEFYTIQYKTNLLSAAWYSIPGMTSMPGDIGLMTRTVSTNYPAVFYRIRSSATP